MNFIRNPEIKKGIITYIIISAVLCVCGLFVGKSCGLYVLFCCAVLFVFYIISTKKRYSRIVSLTDEIEKVLHDGNIIMIEDFDEGELSILANEVKRMFSKLHEQNENLKKEKVVLSDSLADISHQLRTPLTSINIVLSLLSEPEVSDERRFELISELMSLLSATDKLVTMLLKIAKIDASAVSFQKNEVRVFDCVRNAASVLEIAFELKNQTLEIDINDEAFTGDIDWTGEAIGNILKNCMEHTPENGKITVRAEETPIYTAITISDNGGGIDESDLPHLFERFYKGSKSSANNFGIGLNLAYLIINGQNGTLRAFNKNGGANFEIKFYKTVV